MARPAFRVDGPEEETELQVSSTTGQGRKPRRRPPQYSLVKATLFRLPEKNLPGLTRPQPHNGVTQEVGPEGREG
jgi:hypothetical protein